jgi:hypothetical protein
MHFQQVDDADDMVVAILQVRSQIAAFAVGCIEVPEQVGEDFSRGPRRAPVQQ